ncbi:hypothetical protein H1P_4090006 [Hyella patelloides LEGE 07179]|uniref:Uncharacterized protein n=1 Tax=Hyella patelloides LEGE 07179 TaxID=945734 RepID=A0A563VXE7_9CYAN|nr:hypothetical protein [Hyella patelloides]VEP16134.1 hypothetical protein H1P_4090006 [Hyella patelloides LEGE 07179]
MEITFRTASKDDLDVLDRTHTQNMREYVEQNYPWDNDLFKKKFIYNDYIQRISFQFETVQFVHR